MQPTELQVQRTIEALGVDTTPRHGGGIPRDTLEIVLNELPDGLLETLEDGPAVRQDRLEEAKDRLQHGDTPSDDELASRIVGRLVCDRLR